MSFGADVPAVEATDIPPGSYVLDVREPDEWAAGHAPDAVHIPMGELSGRAAEIPGDQNVYVICRSGARSARVTVALNNAGWLAFNVDGGMQSWVVNGRPIVTDSGAEPYVA